MAIARKGVSCSPGFQVRCRRLMSAECRLIAGRRKLLLVRVANSRNPTAELLFVASSVWRAMGRGRVEATYMWVMEREILV
ncbi:unnamed protein product [Linum trigynum]|uniref:Uncharacterized protein n=1 Tax=Linum trigynum TaxID=586398 RepID=A0AAV2FUC7_9ROSI